MAYYSMTLTWEITCKFIFKQWYSETQTSFAIGCVTTAVLAFLSMALPYIRKVFAKILFRKDDGDQSNYVPLANSVDSQKNASLRMTKNEIFVRNSVLPAIQGVFQAFLHVCIMVIMMSMNGYVILAIILGYVIGFLVFCEIPKESCDCK